MNESKALAAKETKEALSVGTALSMVAVALLTVVVGKLFFKLDTTLVLFISAALVSCVAVCFCGIPWDKIEEQIAVGIRAMGVPVIILMEIGMLVGAWMISGTIPTIMYYGMVIMNPRYFLVLTCLSCSVMSVASGTSWGTLSTLSGGFLQRGSQGTCFSHALYDGSRICGFPDFISGARLPVRRRNHPE